MSEQWDDRSPLEKEVDKLRKKITELEETVRYENMRNKAYNEQFLKDKDEKKILQAEIDRLMRLHEHQTRLLWDRTAASK